MSEGTRAADLKPFRLRMLCADSTGLFGLTCGPDSVLAHNRVDAYLRVYRDLTSKGFVVTVAGVGGVRPLGFTDEEIEEVQRTGVPLNVALLPLRETGRQIEFIEE